MDIQESFKILGLDGNANAEQAKRAYRSQVRQWHPDKFPEKSTEKYGAEEQLKCINIAYDRVKAYLKSHHVGSDSNIKPSSPSSHPKTGQDPTPAPKKTKTRSWIDHLFTTLNAFGNSPAPPSSKSTKGRTYRRKTFNQILTETTGGRLPKKQSISRNSGGKPSRPASEYGRHRHKGSTIGTVGNAKNPGPVKPVERIKGIGKHR